MEPNLHEKDAVFVEMISKYFTTPERGQIMTVNATGLTGYTKEEKIIKRVIGLPGETVTIKDGNVYINGVLLDEPYLASNVRTYMNDDGTASGYDNITLGAGEYYFMGDNRGASLDSRVLGPIPISRIKSHVFAKIYPFDDMGLL
jgi:signal peptidase I